MMMMLLLAAGIAVAEPTPPPPPVAKSGTPVTPAMPSADDFAKMLKMFDKIFPPQPDPEPARLAKGRGVALVMWPDGTYGDLTESFLTSMADIVLDMKPSDLDMLKPDEKSDPKDKKSDTMKVAAKPAEPDFTLREKLRRDDPNFDRRATVITAAIHEELKRLSPLLEPPLREGLARSLARRFTEAQLADLQTFFTSPTGKVYARESFKMWLDGDVMRASMNSMPALMMQMPAAFERIKAAADTVPSPPKAAKKD